LASWILIIRKRCVSTPSVFEVPSRIPHYRLS